MTNFQPTPGWDREIPKYRVTRDVLPAPKARFKNEPPFAETWQSNIWQYGERPMAAGEIIKTTEWPHPSFRPLNFSAEKVLAFFNSEMKSRLPRKPWFDGRVRLDNGLSNVPRIVDVKPPQIQPMNLRPVA